VAAKWQRSVGEDSNPDAYTAYISLQESGINVAASFIYQNVYTVLTGVAALWHQKKWASSLIHLKCHMATTAVIANSSVIN